MDGLLEEDTIPTLLDRTEDGLIPPENCDVSDHKEFDICSVENGPDQISLCDDSEVGTEECYQTVSPLPYRAASIERISSQVISIKVRKYLCKHCGYATMSYSNIMYHLKYVHPKIATNGKLFQHYRAISHPQGIKKVPLMYFCQYCNYITLDIRHFMLHSNKAHPKRKANPYKQGSPVTTAANRKYLEALCLAKEEPKKSKIKAHRLLTMYHPDSRLLQSHINETPISCFVCKKRFSDGLEFSKHYESKHSHLGKDAITRNFNCKICTHICATRMGLYKHYSEAHFIDLYDSWYTPTPNSVLRQKKNDMKKMYDHESPQEFLERVDESLLSLLNFGNAADVQIAAYHIPCVACEFSSRNLLSLLKHYKQNHRGCFPKRFELFLTEKFQAYIKTFVVAKSVADFIEKENGAWITDNHQVVQYYEYTCSLCSLRCDWLSQFLNHFEDNHSDTVFSLNYVKRSRSVFPNTSFSSFLQCCICHHVEFTRINMAMHYREKHGMFNCDVEIDEVFSMAERRLCGNCSMVGNFDALQWHSFEQHGNDKVAWANLCSANDGSTTDLVCSVCRYIPSDDVDLILHYQSKHFAKAMTYTYSCTDNLYRCLHCGLEMMSLMDIASHCDFCLSRGQESTDGRIKYSACKVCHKVFTADATDTTKWKHIVEHHCANSIPFTIYDLPSFTLKYGFWDIGETTSHESRRSMRSYRNARSHNLQASGFSDDGDVFGKGGSDHGGTESEVSLRIGNVHSKRDIQHTSHEVGVMKRSAQSHNGNTGEGVFVDENSLRIDDNSTECVAVLKYFSENTNSDHKKVEELKYNRSDSESTPLKVLSPESHDFDTIQDTEELLPFEDFGKNKQSTQNRSRTKQTARKSYSKKNTKSTMHCRYCSRIFVEENELETHLVNNHGCIFSARCFGCDATFTDVSCCISHHQHIHGVAIDTRTVLHFLLEDIARSAEHKEKFICVRCGYESFSNIMVLNHYNSRHVSNSQRKRRHFKNGSYSCRWCEYVSKNITSTRAHIKSKHGKVISYRSLGHFTCSEDVSSDSSDSADSDYRPPAKWRKKYQNRAKRFRKKTFALTQVCDYKDDTEYSNPEIFRQTHIRYKHQNRYPFVCSLCKKSFICSTAYLNHCKTRHRNLGLLHLCSKHIVQLPEPSVIAQFIRSRSHCQDRANDKSIFCENLWPCKLCSEEFHSLEKFQEHNFEKHSEQRTKICRYCDFTSIKDEEIVHHAKVHSGFHGRSIESPSEVQILKVSSSSTAAVSKKRKVSSNARKSIRSGDQEISIPVGSRTEQMAPIMLHKESDHQFVTQPNNDEEISSKQDSVHRLSCKFCCYTCEDLGTLDGHLANFHKIKKNYQLAMPVDASDDNRQTQQQETVVRVKTEVIYISDSEEGDDNDNQVPDSCPSISVLPFPESKITDSSDLTCPYCGLYSSSITILKRHMQRHES